LESNNVKKRVGALRLALSAMLVGALCLPLGVSSPASAMEQFAYQVDPDGNAWITGCASTCPENLVIPETIGYDYPVTAIAPHALQGYDIATVSLPDSLLSIGDHAFAANKITSVTFGRFVEVIDKSAFQGNLLTHVKIPSGVKYIGAIAFAYNPQLVDVTFYGDAPAVGELSNAPAGITIFYGDDNMRKVFRPVNASGWGQRFQGVRMGTISYKVPALGKIYQQNFCLSQLSGGVADVELYSDASGVPNLVETPQYSLDDGRTWRNDAEVYNEMGYDMSFGGLTCGQVYKVRVRLIGEMGPGRTSSRLVIKPVSWMDAPDVNLSSTGFTTADLVVTPGFNYGSPVRMIRYTRNGGQTWTNSLYKANSNGQQVFKLRNVTNDDYEPGQILVQVNNGVRDYEGNIWSHSGQLMR